MLSKTTKNKVTPCANWYLQIQLLCNSFHATTKTAFVFSSCVCAEFKSKHTEVTSQTFTNAKVHTKGKQHCASVHGQT